MDEIEELRQEALAEAIETVGAPSEADLVALYAPGSFGCHEALHTTSVAMDMIDGHVLEHPAIVANPEWFRLAAEAHGALFALYQAIGELHLPAMGDDGKSDPAR